MSDSHISVRFKRETLMMQMCDSPDLCWFFAGLIFVPVRAWGLVLSRGPLFSPGLILFWEFSWRNSFFYKTTPCKLCHYTGGSMHRESSHFPRIIQDRMMKTDNTYTHIHTHKIIRIIITTEIIEQSALVVRIDYWGRARTPRCSQLNLFLGQCGHVQTALDWYFPYLLMDSILLVGAGNPYLSLLLLVHTVQ